MFASLSASLPHGRTVHAPLAHFLPRLPPVRSRMPALSWHLPHATGTAPLYVNNTTLSARVGSLNPRWNQPSDDATLYAQVRRAGSGSGTGTVRCTCCDRCNVRGSNAERHYYLYMTELAEAACMLAYPIPHAKRHSSLAFHHPLTLQFLKAVELTGAEFAAAVDYVAAGWLPGRRPVAEALARRFEVHPSGAILQLTEVGPCCSCKSIS